MAEIELQGTYVAEDFQSRGFVEPFSQANNNQQHDVLTQLGKLPVLKVLSLS